MEEKSKPETKAVTVQIDQQGLIEFSNQQELANAARLMIQLKMAPEALAEKGPEAVASALLFCKQYNLPARSMNQMAWIKGSLTQWGSLYQAIAEKHENYGEKEEYWLDENQKRICAPNLNLNAKAHYAVCRVKPKNSQTWSEYTFSLDEAKAAGLYPALKWDKTTGKKVESPDSPWNKYTKDMLMHKARKRAIDAHYASAVHGAVYHEDMMEVVEEREARRPEDVTQSVIEDLEYDEANT